MSSAVPWPAPGPETLLKRLRAAYRRFCEQPEKRDWLLRELGEGAYLAHGPFGLDRGKIIDLVSWQLDAPHRFTTILGAGWLGAETVSAAWANEMPLRIYSSPWAYLKGRVPGAVPLSLAAYPCLWRATQIIADSFEHAEAIEKKILAMNSIPPPILLVENDETEAA